MSIETERLIIRNYSEDDLGALAGLLGSLAESVVGTVAERRGWLDNDQLNALNTALGGGLGYGLALAAGPGRLLA